LRVEVKKNRGKSRAYGQIDGYGRFSYPALLGDESHYLHGLQSFTAEAIQPFKPEEMTRFSLDVKPNPALSLNFA
jgi:hypothetical protein